MSRLVIFQDGEGRARAEKQYMIVLEGSVYGATSKRSMGDMRKLASLLTKVRDIGDPKPDGAKLQSGDVDRVLKQGEQRLYLTDDELKMLQQRIESTQWNTVAVVEMVDTHDVLLEQAPSVDDSAVH